MSDDREETEVSIHGEPAADVDFWPTAEEASRLFADYRRLVLPNGHMIVRAAGGYVHWSIDHEWPEHLEGIVDDPTAVIEALRVEYETEEAALVSQRAEADKRAAAWQAEQEATVEREAAYTDDVVQRQNDLVNAVGAHLATVSFGLPGRLSLRNGYRIEARARYQLLRPGDMCSEIVFEGSLHECLAKAREHGAL